MSKNTASRTAIHQSIDIPGPPARRSTQRPLRLAANLMLTLVSLAACDDPDTDPDTCDPGETVSLGVYTSSDGEVSQKLNLPPGDYCLQFINGPTSYKHTSAARVLLSDTEIWRENSFSKNIDAGTKAIHVEGEETLTVQIKSGKKKGSKQNAIELRVGSPGGSTLHEVTPAGGGFTADGVTFSFAEGALDQDTIFKVDCDVPADGIGPRCEISPHRTFEFGNVEVTFPIEPEKFPEGYDWADIIGFDDGVPIPGISDVDLETFSMYPTSFCTQEPGVAQSCVSDPPVGYFEPRDFESTLANSYSDKYGIGIGLQPSGVITAIPGYLDSEDHSKGFRDGWKEDGVATLCRKISGENSYTPVISMPYKKGTPGVNFGQRAVSLGKALYFVALRSEGTLDNPPGCGTAPQPPIYRSADLTITKEVAGASADKQSEPPDVEVSYSRHDQLAEFIRSEIVANSQSPITGLIWVYYSSGEMFNANLLMLSMFAPRQPWDQKPVILETCYGQNVFPAPYQPFPICHDAIEINAPAKDDDTCFPYHYPVRGAPYEVYYDIWSNIHYGYVGRMAGYSEEELQAAAWFPVLAGKNDAVDEVSTQIGFDLFDDYPDPNDITVDAINDAIASRISDILAAQSEQDYIDASGTVDCDGDPPFSHLIDIDNGR